MRLKNLLPTLVVSSLTTMIAVAFMLAVVSVDNHAAAQTPEEPLAPLDITSMAAVTFTGGPTISLKPDPVIAVGNVATINVQVRNTSNITMTELRTDYEPSPPSGIGGSDCPKPHQSPQAEIVFGPTREMGPGQMVNYTCVVTGVAATMPFTLRVRSAHPLTPTEPLTYYLGDSDATLITVNSVLTNHIYLPVVVEQVQP